jgi:hypothetical protein
MQRTPAEPTLSAYRRAATRPDDAPDEEEETFRERAHPVLIFVWAASLARVVGAVYFREVFGAEATLALLTLVAVTWYWLASRRGHAKQNSAGRRA